MSHRLRLHDSKKVGKNNSSAQGESKTQHSQIRGKRKGMLQDLRKDRVVDQQGTDAALLGVVDQQGGGVVSLPTEERHRHRRRQHVGYTFKLSLPVLLAYSIEGGTSAGVALLQLP